MTEDVKQNAAPTPTREQQFANMLAQAKARLPRLVEVAKMYNGAYPAETTSADVIRAVTVATPLTDYMLLVGILVNLLIDREEKATAANDGTPA